MCTKNRYCSPMSCTGQSDANQSSSIAAPNGEPLAPGDRPASPAGTTFGPMTLAA